MAQVGGALAFVYVLLHLFFSRYVSWIMYLEIIRNLFKIDPSRGKKPKAAKKLQSKDPNALLYEAKQSIQNRVKLTPSTTDNIVLFLEALTRKFACRQTRFARIVNEGITQIRAELNIYNYMRKIRMTDAVVKALTTFY